MMSYPSVNKNSIRGVDEMIVAIWGKLRGKLRRKPKLIFRGRLVRQIPAGWLEFLGHGLP